MNFIRRYCCCAATNVIKWENTIPFVPPVTSGIVIKVYDGDTITIASKLPYKKSPMYRFRVRLGRIDAPEIRTKNKTEAAMAIISRDKLAEKILNKKITLTNVKTEKYGRVLADIHYKKVCFNDWMIKQKLAVNYDGGTKANVNWGVYMKQYKN